MSVQFIHHITDDMKGFTIALESISLTRALEIASISAFQQSEFIIRFGIAKVHPKDRYNKKTGRGIAISNTKNESVSLDGFSIIDGRISLGLKHKDGYTLLFSGIIGKPEMRLINIIGG